MKLVKPYRGKIYNWSKYIPQGVTLKQIEDYYGKTLGYCIQGFTTKTPHLDTVIRTSLIVIHKTKSIETLNSRYTLVGKEQVKDDLS